jgi:hypothetical protein
LAKPATHLPAELRGIITDRRIFRESADDIYDSIGDMEVCSEPLPDDIDTLRAEVAAGRARAAADQALIAHQQLQIAKLRHALYGHRSERTTRLIEQMELGLEEAEATATEDEIAAEQAAACTTNVAAFARKRPSRQPFPSTCRASAWSSPHRSAACAAAARDSADLART